MSFKIKDKLFSRLRNQNKKIVKVNVNDEKRFIFIHIPKNAGSSLSSALGFESITHATVNDVKSVVGRNKFRTYFKFSFVRNPFDRFISLYNYARMKESKYHSATHPEEALYGKHLDFDILEQATLNEAAHYLVEQKLRHDFSWLHWNPQVSWLRDDKGDISLDFIGRFENINSDYDILKKRLNLQYELPYFNKSSRSSGQYQHLYDAETKTIVEEYYKQDLLCFDYQF